MCQQACNRCFRCQRIRLIDSKNYVSNPLYSYPRDHTLQLNIRSLAGNLNLSWQIGLISRLRVRNSRYSFVQASDSKRFEGLEKCKFLVNVMVFVNSRTNFVYSAPLYSKSLSELKVVFETFLHKCSLSKVIFIGDMELSFQKLRRTNYPHQILAIYDSKQAAELTEKFDVTFKLHAPYHSFFTSKVENCIKIVKKSFSSFAPFNLNFHDLTCLLSSIARVINDRPISLFRVKGKFGFKYYRSEKPDV